MSILQQSVREWNKTFKAEEGIYRSTLKQNDKNSIKNEVFSWKKKSLIFKFLNRATHYGGSEAQLLAFVWLPNCNQFLRLASLKPSIQRAMGACSLQGEMDWGFQRRFQSKRGAAVSHVIVICFICGFPKKLCSSNGRTLVIQGSLIASSSWNAVCNGNTFTARALNLQWQEM